MSQIGKVPVVFQTNFEPKEESPFKVLKIFANVGQRIIENDRLAEINTDKGLQDIEAPQSGILKEIFLIADPINEYLYGTIFCTIEIY